MLIPGSAAASAAAPPAVVIMVQQPNPQSTRRTADKEHFDKTLPPRIVRALSAAQVFIFLVCIVAAIMSIVFEKYGPSDGAAGIWCGFFFGISGALGLLVAWKATTCSIVACMVMNIIAACFTIPLIVWTGIALGQNSHRYHRCYGSFCDDPHRESRQSLLITVLGIQFCCAFCEAIIAISVAVMTCRATCCRSSTGSVSDTAMPTAVMYNGGNGQTAVPITAIPMMPAAAAAATAMPVTPNPVTTESDHPPKYEEAAAEATTGSEDAAVENGSRYQRFD